MNDEWECIECGAPSPPTSMAGCRNCGGQSEIVPKGTRQKLIERPDDVRLVVTDDIVSLVLDDVVLARQRLTR